MGAASETVPGEPSGTERAVLDAHLLGLTRAGERVVAEPLTGGVSSDIHLITAGNRRFCLKRALPTLKVAAEWRAPVSRGVAEAAWLTVVAKIAPRAVPRVLARDDEAGVFALEYLDGATHPLWKRQLAEGVIEQGTAAEVGATLAAIHAATAGDAAIARSFANEAAFDALRLDPYLRATAGEHPDLALTLEELIEATKANHRALIHGDVSPKNILIGSKGPVFLDAECATYGDPAFDLAFCLNHLLLKGAWFPDRRGRYLESFEVLAAAYLNGVDWEEPAGLEERAARLLPGLMLARVDGKSPVEYLSTEEAKSPVHAFARGLLRRPVRRLQDVARAWEVAA